MPGITAFGAYIPKSRLSLAAIAGRPGGEGGPEKAVAGHDEDTVTLAVAAAGDCLREIDRERVDAVLFASTTYPYREKQGASLIAKALGLRRDVRTADHAGSLRAGTTALRGAVDAVAAGSARDVLVVASDCRLAAPGSPLEATFGDGAAAFLVGDADIAVAVEASHVISDEILDVWRSEGDPFVRTWEQRFVVQHGYRATLLEAVRGLFARTGQGPADFASAVLYGPDGRSHAAAAQALGFERAQVQDPLFGRLGNAGAAFAPLLLAAALETARPGDRLLLGSYGDGAEALSLVATEHLEKLGPRRGVSQHLARRRGLPSYDVYLRARNLGVREFDPRAGDGISATVHFRERDEDIGLVGRKCRRCGQIHFPAQRVCYRCHARDEFDPVRLSDRTGTVLAHTLDYFFPAPEPPTIVTMVDVDGCRIHLQMTDALPEEVRLDLPVEFVFRKIHEAGGRPNYFWKCTPKSAGETR